MPVAAAQIWKVDQHLKSESNKKLAVNGEIRARQVRLIDAEGKQLGIVPIEEDEGDVDRYVLSKRLAVERRTAASFLNGATIPVDGGMSVRHT